MIQRVAIANRGEVAVRILRACEELGVQTVLLHSEADRNTRAYRMAQKNICIGPSSSAESYLNIERVIQGAIAAQADAIHPGFGFLSENPEFADRVVAAGLKFIGPSGKAMKLLGDKVECKKLAGQLGVPLIPGYDGRSQEISELLSHAQRIGFPVVVKAAAGGGGRGMKVLRGLNGAEELIESAQREGLAAFGNGKVFLEKYFENAKHIEVQVFADSLHQVRHFFERECSVQRRHQKIIEEAPAAKISQEIREALLKDAVQLVSAARYTGAATVEFLVEGGRHYLLEVNTRLQVEHPVTEEICGIDLVKKQILTAAGDFVFTSETSTVAQGHSIECRIYAENPYLGGVPSPGVCGHMIWPEGPRRRFECGVEEGDEITSFYDPMISKVIVWDESRLRAIQKMQKVLSECVIFGVQTNIPLLQKILSHPDFVNGTMTTQFMGLYFDKAIPAPSIDEKLVQQIRSQIGVRGLNPNTKLLSNRSPFEEGWRI